MHLFRVRTRISLFQWVELWLPAQIQTSLKLYHKRIQVRSKDTIFKLLRSSRNNIIEDIFTYYFNLGRASSTPSIDVFITLLSLGWEGYKKLQSERKVKYKLYYKMKILWE